VGPNALLGGSIAAAAAGIGLVLALRHQRRNASGDASWDGRSGGPEVPDMPLGVPAEQRSGTGAVELPGFPRSDPTQG
jgi:hypothetical protein